MDSVFAQTFGNWELIVVDQAADDETPGWLGELRDTRVAKLRLDKEAERGFAMNQGLAVAKGDFILFLDDGQLLTASALQAHLSALAQSPRAVASIAGSVELDRNGKRKLKLVRRRCKRDVWPDMMFDWMPPSLGQCLFRVQSLQAINGWDEDATLAGVADDHLWLRLTQLGPVVLLPDLLCQHRPRVQSPPELRKLMAKIRKRSMQKNAGQNFELAQQVLQARDSFRLAEKHYRQAESVQALRFYWKALRVVPYLLRSPLTRPLLLPPLLKSLVGVPLFKRWVKKVDLPIRHVVTSEVAFNYRQHKPVADPQNTTVKFWDRCKMLGLEHELRWFWVKAFTAEQWRRRAARYQWIFVLGCNNSGTTLMTRLLESHPMISGVPRGGRGATVVLLPPREANVVRLWTEKLELFRLTEADQHLDALRLIYDWVAAMHFSSRPYILEKAPPDMICARWFQSVFPNAYFIGLVRSGYAVAEGMNRREGYSLDRSARHWNTANKIMLDDARQLKRFMLVQYEDLTRDTATTIQQVSQFLGIDYEPLQTAVNREWKVHNMDNTAAKIQDFNIKSLARLSDSDIDVINRYAGEMLERFGYTKYETTPVWKAQPA